MYKTVHVPHKATKVMLALLLLSLTFMATACGGDPQARQQADHNRVQLDATIQHAQQIGVPSSVLHPILQQEQKLNSSGTPFSPFNDQPLTDYYKNQANSYANLLSQTQALIANTTAQMQLQAQNDMQVFQNALNRRTSQKIGNTQPFTDQYNNDQILLANAQYPKDYALVSQQAKVAIEALGLMGQTYTQLTQFKSTIGQMQQAHIDVTAMQTQYQADLQVFNNTSQSSDFRNLDTMIDAQYEQAVVNSIAALPYVSAVKLSEFKSQIDLLKTYGMDNSAYVKAYQADQAMISKAHTIHDFLVFSNKIDGDIASMHDDLVQGASNYMIGALDREARAWGNAHLYHDTVDGHNYILDAGYTTDGIGYWLNRELGWAYTPDDFQSVVDDENNEFFNLHMMEQDYTDSTPYNQPHATDAKLIQHYNLSGQIIVVSFVEQAMRLYQNGKLVRSFHVTTGRVERPSLPGYWTVQNRQSPTVFKSTEPPGSPYWYPDTPIHYAILYHWGGFFIHDAWWRNDFGPGTQFPHNDSAGTDSFNFDGSHGCINMQEDEAAWLYANTDWNTSIVVY